jgi:hypothetical protein
LRRIFLIVLWLIQGKQISATVSQAFELAFRRYQDAQEVRKQYLELKQKLDKAPPEEKEKIQKEIAALQSKKIAEEDRLQRARDLIKNEADARSKTGGGPQAPMRKAPATSQAKAPAAPAPAPQQAQEKKVAPVCYAIDHMSLCQWALVCAIIALSNSWRRKRLA